MANFIQAQKKARLIKPAKVRSELFKYIRSIEKVFIDANIQQLEDSENAKGKLLEHKSKRYKGVYTEATEEIAKSENPLAPKKAGDPYNFLYTGEFFKGFDVFIKNGDILINSTGTGSGSKADFFDGYKNLFGLTDKNLRAVIDKNILPFILKYYREKLL